MKDNLENSKSCETAGDLVRKLEETTENKRDFHQKILLAMVKQYNPNEKIYSAPAEFVPNIHRDIIKFLKEYDKFKKKSEKVKFVIGYNLSEEIYKNLLQLKDLSKEDLEKLAKYARLKSMQDTNDFLKRHAEDKERFKKEINYRVRSKLDSLVNSTDSAQNTYF